MQPGGDGGIVRERGEEGIYLGKTHLRCIAAHIGLGLVRHRLALLADKGEGDAFLDKALHVAVAAFVLQPEGINLLGAAEQVGGIGEVVLRIVGIGVEMRHIHEVGDIVGILGILAVEQHVLLTERLGQGVLLGGHRRGQQQRH